PDEGRRERGRAIAAVCRIEERRPGLWIVPAQIGGGSYWVRMVDRPPTCTCEDFAKRERDCKHIHAVRLLIEQRAAPGNAGPSAVPGEPDGRGAVDHPQADGGAATDVPAGLAVVQQGSDPREGQVLGAPDRALPGYPRAAPGGLQERRAPPGADGGSGV